MHLQIITFYRAADTYLRQKGFVDDPQAQMTTTEMLTTVLVAAWFFANNIRITCNMMAESGLVPHMLSKSRFHRRRHRIRPEDWQALLDMLAKQHPDDTFAIDTCPISVCHNQRTARSKLYQDDGGAYWGYCTAKDEYYYGLKAHTIVAASGRPVEVLLLCGCSHDLTGMKEMALD